MQDKTQTAIGVRGVALAAPASAARSYALSAFTLTTFLSALLLFSVQPMFAKMVLPVLGGAPSVWAVAMLFFQAALLAGYCYAHLLLRYLPARTSGFVHLALCAAALLTLPIGLPQGFGEPPVGEPYLWQLGIFTVAVGLPFFAVSANAPLLQAWFSATGHPHGRDPYFLYGASNLGSLMALLAYPFALEPAFGLRQLSGIWTAGFIALIVAIASSFLLVRLAGAAPVAAAAGAADQAPGAGPSPTWPQRLAWIGLALVPSALLTAFTNHVTTDIASAPLLWVLPLSLYLLTFVLVFRERPILALPVAVLIGLALAAAVHFFGERVMGWNLSWWTILWWWLGGMVAALVLQLVWSGHSLQWLRSVHLASVVAALLALAQTRHDTWFITAPVGLIVFFASTMVAHRTLYEARPAARHLTEFYLWMSLGGVLGGVFAALIAPKVFSEVFEYPILLALTMACRPRALDVRFTRERVDDLLILWLCIAAAILAVLRLPDWISQMPSLDVSQVPGAAWWIAAPMHLWNGVRAWVYEWGATAAAAVFLAGLLVAFWRSPPRQLVLALGMCAAVVMLPSGVRRHDAERSYFGVYRVYTSGDYNILMHGTTLHGAQRIRNEAGEIVVDTSPVTYYHVESPIAKSIEIVREHVTQQGGTKRFGVTGLGAGSLTCHASEGESWRVFEIDPVMVNIASNTDNFSYLASCQPNPPDIVLGDARLTLAKEKNGSFDMLIIDAFSSDAVPIHLMTAEALKLYLDKVAENGIVVLHISNRYLDLDAVLGATSRLLPDAFGIIVSDDSADGSYAATSSTIAVFAKSLESLAPFRALSDVRELDARGVRPWTDDFSDLIGPFLSKIRN
jgi:hypothetical protein